MKIVRCSSFFFAAFTFASAARARELTYVPAEGCPAADEVASRIDATAPEGRPATLTVTRGRSGYHGVVTIGSGDRAVERSVDARTCAAVVDALALVVALDHEPPDEPPAPPPPPPSTPADADRAPPRAPRAVDLSVGLLASATRAIRAETLTGASLFVDVASSGPTLDVPWLRPSARLLVTRAYIASPSDEPWGFVPRLTTVSLEGCPLGWSPDSTSMFVASACARGEVGALEVETFDGSDGTTRLWSALGAIARARFLLGSPGHLRWAIEASTGLLAPLRRDRILVDRTTSATLDFAAQEMANTTSPIPAITWTAAIGAAVVLP